MPRADSGAHGFKFYDLIFFSSYFHANRNLLSYFLVQAYEEWLKQQKSLPRPSEQLPESTVMVETTLDRQIYDFILESGEKRNVICQWRNCATVSLACHS